MVDILPPSKHPEGKMKHVLQVDVHSFIDLAKICPFVIAGPVSDSKSLCDSCIFNSSQAKQNKTLSYNSIFLQLASNLINKPRSTKRDIFTKHSISYIPKTPNDHKKEFEAVLVHFS
ncbi:hypothetical protein Gohar_010825 [Gossypium harknessii]|uniref:Uncharacterized protein n=1 Tax=Gossypium harknessii TaxID=34285 RepID=A0A7J9GS37_9ROSI|nr:hypothetical protein [Gossypium harknessii]